MSGADEMLEAAASRGEELAAGDLTAQPRRKVAILSCMDTRIDLFSIFGLEKGDVHIIRNAGGLVTDDAVRSLAASQRLLDTEEIVVLMHEGCGLHGADDDDFAGSLAADGAEPAWRLGAFGDLDEELAAGLERLRSSPELTSRDRIRGFVFDPVHGTVREVVGSRDV